jgi:hypothetical protein
MLSDHFIEVIAAGMIALAYIKYIENQGIGI